MRIHKSARMRKKRFTHQKIEFILWFSHQFRLISKISRACCQYLALIQKAYIPWKIFYPTPFSLPLKRLGIFVLRFCCSQIYFRLCGDVYQHHEIPHIYEVWKEFSLLSKAINLIHITWVEGMLNIKWHWKAF